MRFLACLTAVTLLVACQPVAETTEAAEAAPQDAPSPAAAPAGPAVEPPPAFVGFWAAEPSWCSNTIGPERPIEVTATEFRGYENTCQITNLTATDTGWTATFVCQAEGTTSNEAVSLKADDNRLEVTWIDEAYAVEWRRCPA